MKAPHVFLPDDDAEEFISAVAITEDFHGDSELATAPIESGAKITDHIDDQPRMFSADVAVSNNPVGNTFTEAGGYSSKRVTIPSMNGAPSQQDLIVFTIEREANRVQELWEQLDDYRKRGVIGSVVTSIGEIPSMVIKSIAMNRGPKTIGHGQIHIDYAEFRVVNTQTVAAPQPREPRGAPSASKGAQPGAGVNLDEVFGRKPGESWAVTATRLDINQVVNGIVKGFGAQ